MAIDPIEFGFYPKSMDFTARGGIEIATLDGLADKVEAVQDPNHNVISNGWIFVPPGGVPPPRHFGLPKTHTIRHLNPDSHDHITFLVWVLSFFLGNRLTTTEAGFLDATPIRAGALSDFVLTGPSPEEAAVEIAELYWQRWKHDPLVPKRIAAAIHCLFMSKSRTAWPFERFTWWYVAFDACYKTALDTSVCQQSGHAQRFSSVCAGLSMPVPEWTEPGGVVATRNNSIHEGLFFGEPLGFALGDHGTGRMATIHLELEGFVSRVLCALLGVSDRSYIDSKLTTRARLPLALRATP